jgi:hypothetical protein
MNPKLGVRISLNSHVWITKLCIQNAYNRRRSTPPFMPQVEELPFNVPHFPFTIKHVRFKTT